MWSKLDPIIFETPILLFIPIVFILILFTALSMAQDRITSEDFTMKQKIGHVTLALLLFLFGLMLIGILRYFQIVSANPMM